ncbi:hypothetical protein [Legionella oakridgensis]|uniref:Uncharacterized protein n=2 Tax=Legionella oakridgensis TaxID=29423 RepID=W0BC71_9GAMM|nr:hypothetical protein [Legionella oakridgensis]AHE66227.1 hypothetical protein Loa_00658 [Legionella oakridgensis ATCC 33761 = DSM 21215]ETO93976.1 hypothetical protein LOR_93c25210 [Legionella oakridgensis RV-2-2007]KTD44775.1 hypothetical protein Loak_0025 [Legionella oakridgensis]STY16130.1 Uncharacterised protein [Legionella longbeachae]
MLSKEQIRRKAGIPATDTSRDQHIANQAKISATLEYRKWGFFGKLIPTIDYLQASYVTGVAVTTAAEKAIEADTMMKP